jgi:hypothetical protein
MLLMVYVTNTALLEAVCKLRLCKLRVVILIQLVWKLRSWISKHIKNMNEM